MDTIYNELKAELFGFLLCIMFCLGYITYDLVEWLRDKLNK